MNKNKQYLAAAMMLCCLFSCKENRNEMLYGSWRSTKVENRDKDEFFRNSSEFIDTMGKGNTDEENIDIYGVANIDSLRRELRIQFDSAFAAQLSIDTQSVFTFYKDSTISFEFPGKTEKGKWYFDKAGKLVLDETNELGQTDQLKVEIASLTESNMQLIFIREVAEGLSDTSIVSFRKEKK